MMSEQEMNERILAVNAAGRLKPDDIEEYQLLRYQIAVRLCQLHQFTAAAEGLLEAAERMVGIERGEKE